MNLNWLGLDQGIGIGETTTANISQSSNRLPLECTEWNGMDWNSLVIALHAMAKQEIET